MSATPTPQVGQGSTLGYLLYVAGSTPPTTGFTTLGTISGISPASFSVGKAESTTLSSTIKTYVPTIPEVTAGFKLLLERGDATVWAFRTQATTFPIPSFWFKVTNPDTSYDVFCGFLTSWKPDDIETETLMSASVELTLNTLPVFTAAPTS